MKTKSVLQKDCDRVNALLKEEAGRLRLGTQFGRARLGESRSDLQSYSYWARMEFREYVRRTLEKHGGSMNAQSLIYDGARLLGVNPETTKRYLRMLRAAGGPFAGLGDVVTLNGRYVAEDEDGYWEEDGNPDPDQPHPAAPPTPPHFQRAKMERRVERGASGE